jgi:hypothetical protein
MNSIIPIVHAKECMLALESCVLGGKKFTLAHMTTYFEKAMIDSKQDLLNTMLEIENLVETDQDCSINNHKIAILSMDCVARNK